MRKFYWIFGLIILPGILVFSYFYLAPTEKVQAGVDVNLGIRLEASVDGGATWHNYSGDTDPGGESVTAQSGDTIRLRLKTWNGSDTHFADGATVVIGGLQLAFYMGFKEVYLLGCDCDFSKQGHFYDEPLESYEKEIIEVPRWFESYKMCKKAYKKDGRKIINATVGGKLEVFKRQSLEEIMGKGEND